jgi:positive regulator of sigma E activity
VAKGAIRERDKMPKHVGFVANLKENDKADVIIRPGTPGIPNAPEVSKKVCHTPTDGSTVNVEAWNRAGAQAGDWVSVSQSPGTLRKNAVTLLGIPSMGLILGIVAGAAVYQNSGLHPMVSVIVGAAVLLIANLIAAVRYRRRSAENPPVITRIIKTHKEE